MHTLSKSDFKLAQSCPTKLYYRERHYADNQQSDPYLQMLAEGGYMIELLARQLFPDGVTLGHGPDAAASAAETLALLAQEKPAVTLFEGTLLAGRRLARVDILRKGPDGFDLYEVKSSGFDPEDVEKRRSRTGSAFRSLKKPHGIARDWREDLEDVTYQVTILRDLFPGVAVRAHLILVDKTREVEFDGMPDWFRIVREDEGRVATAQFVGDPELARRSGITVGIDVSAEVAELEPEVRAASDLFVSSLEPTLTRIPPQLGGRCAKCEFRLAPEVVPNGFLECWGARGAADPHVLELYQGRDFREELIRDGIDGIAEIGDDRLASRSGTYAERQRIHVRHARSGEEWVDEALGPSLARSEWPLHFIDFEAAGLALPHHRGMRPYGRIAWQWSCHTIAGPGAPLEHTEFINLDPAWPNERFAASLRERLGDRGTILVWSGFEADLLREIADELTLLGTGDPALVDWLRAAALPPKDPGSRIIDMLPLCREHYYHPRMRGSYSIKAVLDAIWKSAPDVRARFAELTGNEGDADLGPYAALPPLLINGVPQTVAEGTGAVRAYFAMVYGAERDDPAVGAAWRKLLLDYCRLDTLAMVLIWEHWRSRTRAH